MEQHQGLLQNFLDQTFQHQLHTKKFLVAVSGGVDSMVLLHLFRQSKFNFSVAHCNFQLRGEASNLDEKLVRDYCEKHQIQFFSTRFDVESYQNSGNYSLEMACRNLRYDWFSDLMIKHDFEVLSTAHHLNDQLETFLINLSRGSGIKGLGGMKLCQNQMFRPLLSMKREEIVAFAKAHQISWREDETNQTNDYVRNFIRNEISPLLNQLHPAFLDNFEKSNTHLQHDFQLIENHIKQLKSTLFLIENETIKIEISALQKLNPLQTYLHYLFDEYDFDSKEIEKLLHAENNAEIRNMKFRMLKYENALILQENSTKIWKELTFDLNENPYNCSNFVFQQSKNHSLYWDETLDADLIRFPLTLRSVKEGDFFYPLGMKSKKKINKFLKDLKLSKFEKEEVKILEDAEGCILWVSPHRIDDRFKISEQTINFLNIKLC